jgi:DNA polymerase V
MRTPGCIALVDSDNYYYACQAVFEPQLDGHPVVILGSNDGAIIARSRQAKLLGIPMGVPAFEYQALLANANVVSFSANMSLYGDMSRRVAEVLVPFAGNNVEHYSIDETFLDLTHVSPDDRFSFACQIRATVKQWTGISVSIGLGSSKVLAKLASRIAKENPDGVVDLTDPVVLHEVLSRTPVSALWGINSHRTKALTQVGINTALQLREANEQWIRRHMHVTVLRLVYELRGMQALPLDLAPPPHGPLCGLALLVSRSEGWRSYEKRSLSLWRVQPRNCVSSGGRPWSCRFS